MPGLKTLQQRDLQYFAAKAGHTDVAYAAYTPATLNDIADEDGSKAETPIAIYYYHPDHLGSNTFITDISGKPYQLFLNLPFGESMAEQSSLGYFQSPYKFNGKELDKETGLYYYGARYYDPRTSVWLSVDPLVEKMPNQSPYNYCSNNSISFFDPDGKFGVPIHYRIISSAIKQLNLESKTSSAFINTLISGTTYSADYAGALSDWHFDGQTNFTEVNNKWNSLNKDISMTISDIGRMNKNLGGYDVDKLGNLIHNVEDFYAHSNYVELYVEYYKATNNGANPTDIPIFDDGAKIPEFKALMERKTVDKNGNYQGLHTGTYDFSKKDGGHGPNTHFIMNKDNATGMNGKLAEKAALKHTKIILNKTGD